MDENPFHSKSIGHKTRVLPTCPAKAGHCVLRDIIAALYTDLLDRVGHVLDRDAQEALRQFFRCLAVSDLIGKRLKLRTHDLRIKRLIRRSDP